MLNHSMKKLFPESLKNNKVLTVVTLLTLMIAFVVATVFGTATNEQADTEVKKGQQQNYANRFAGSAITTVASKKYKTTARLNMRKGPSTKYKVIKSIPKGKSVTYISRQGNWYKVSYKGKKGYVSSSYLKGTTKKTATSGRKVKVSTTAYTAYCAGCSGITATGINLRKYSSKKVIAVDPRVIPLGSRVYVPGYGVAIAGDTGGAIKGNKIDLFMSSKSKALNWGRRTVTVTVY